MQSVEEKLESRAQAYAPTRDASSPSWLWQIVLADFRVILERDPAASNWLEVLFCYPGLHALWCYRLSHWLYGTGMPLVPRLISHLARCLTGVEIHPGAKIGPGVFIDHGMGVVIGETAIVGKGCLIYQGVTLGGTGKETGKRHPTLGEQVVVGAGAKVLGNIHIGSHVRIGAGSVVLRDVPVGCTVVGIPGRVVYRQKVTANPPSDFYFPDSEAQVIRVLFDRVKSLEQEITQLRLDSGAYLPKETQEQSQQTMSDSNILIEEFLDGAGI